MAQFETVPCFISVIEDRSLWPDERAGEGEGKKPSAAAPGAEQEPAKPDSPPEWDYGPAEAALKKAQERWTDDGFSNTASQGYVCLALTNLPAMRETLISASRDELVRYLRATLDRLQTHQSKTKPAVGGVSPDDLISEIFSRSEASVRLVMAMFPRPRSLSASVEVEEEEGEEEQKELTKPPSDLLKSSGKFFKVLQAVMERATAVVYGHGGEESRVRLLRVEESILLHRPVGGEGQDAADDARIFAIRLLRARKEQDAAKSIQIIEEEILKAGRPTSEEAHVLVLSKYALLDASEVEKKVQGHVLQLADLYAASEDKKDDLIAHLRKFVKKYPSNPTFLLRLALLQDAASASQTYLAVARLYRADEAVGSDGVLEMVEKAVEADENNVEAFQLRVEVLEKDVKDTFRASRECRNLGRLLKSLERFEEAGAVLEHALSLEDDFEMRSALCDHYHSVRNFEKIIKLTEQKEQDPLSALRVKLFVRMVSELSDEVLGLKARLGMADGEKKLILRLPGDKEEVPEKRILFEAPPPASQKDIARLSDQFSKLVELQQRNADELAKLRVSVEKNRAAIVAPPPRKVPVPDDDIDMPQLLAAASDSSEGESSPPPRPPPPPEQQPVQVQVQVQESPPPAPVQKDEALIVYEEAEEADEGSDDAGDDWFEDEDGDDDEDGDAAAAQKEAGEGEREVKVEGEREVEREGEGEDEAKSWGQARDKKEDEPFDEYETVSGEVTVNIPNPAGSRSSRGSRGDSRRASLSKKFELCERECVLRTIYDTQGSVTFSLAIIDDKNPEAEVMGSYSVKLGNEVTKPATTTWITAADPAKISRKLWKGWAVPQGISLKHLREIRQDDDWKVTVKMNCDKDDYDDSDSDSALWGTDD